MKESIQLQYASSTTQGKWPSNEDCPQFEETAKRFMKKCNDVSYNVMRLFAMGLEMEDVEWFSKAHDIERNDSMSTLRCILYHDTDGKKVPEGHWRAGYKIPLLTLSSNVDNRQGPYRFRCPNTTFPKNRPIRPRNLSRKKRLNLLRPRRYLDTHPFPPHNHNCM